jgi:uncharacterized protein (UPF0333 family)
MVIDIEVLIDEMYLINLIIVFFVIIVTYYIIEMSASSDSKPVVKATDMEPE